MSFVGRFSSPKVFLKKLQVGLRHSSSKEDVKNGLRGSIHYWLNKGTWSWPSEGSFIQMTESANLRGDLILGEK
jgi:hypothetical protein